MDTTTRAGAGRARRGARGRADLIWVAACLVAVAGLAVRWHSRAVQSYWTDEQFSVFQAQVSSPRAVIRIGLSEVHTPLFAMLLHAWIRLGAHAAAWARILPVTLGAAAVVVTLVACRR